MLIKDLFIQVPTKKEEYWKYFDFSVLDNEVKNKSKFSLQTNSQHYFLNTEIQKEKFLNIPNVVSESYVIRGKEYFILTFTAGLIKKDFIFYIPETEVATLNIHLKTTKEYESLIALLKFNFQIEGFLTLNIESDIDDYYIFESFNINMKKNSKLIVNYYSKGIKSRKSFFYAKQEANSYFDFKYRSFLIRDNNTDLTIITDTVEENCFSNHDIKCILNDNSIFSGTGEIIIGKMANNAEAYHYNSTIALSDDVRINARPILKISNGNVQCSHGSPSYYISDSDIFYMLSRGIDKKAAQIMYLKSFLNTDSSMLNSLIEKGVK
jgi:hypothetical protein